MRTNGDGSLTRSIETDRRYEVMEMHLFDGNAHDEEAPYAGPIARPRAAWTWTTIWIAGGEALRREPSVKNARP